MLTLSIDKLAYIIEKAREFDAEVPADADATEGSNPTDDQDGAILFDTPDNPTEVELRDAIDGLTLPEREELLALLWLGRGDYDAESWPQALRQARETASATETSYLVGTPMLADCLTEGIAALGLSLEGYERG